MSKVVMMYMSREGQTKKISERIQHCLTQKGHTVEIYSIIDLPTDFSLTIFDAVILGCPIRYGKHYQPFRQFVEQHTQQLENKPSFFFSVNLTARKPNRAHPYNNLYLQKYLKSIAWKPDLVDVFAGALRYSQYDPFNKGMIRLIMKLTGGPTDTHTDVEFTNWRRVIKYAQEIDNYLTSRHQAPESRQRRKKAACNSTQHLMPTQTNC